MSKSPEWLPIALSSLDFFAYNPEYKNEFGHAYIAERCGVTRMTLNRNKVYMDRYHDVAELLKAYKLKKSTKGGAPIKDDREKLDEERDKSKKLARDIELLQLRLNDCYQLLEDQGIDPEFVYPKRLKKHREA
ncbi:hypothetical protein ACPV5R_11130 [Vibrio astriarenae]